jgi:hypothetical protein
MPEIAASAALPEERLLQLTSELISSDFGIQDPSKLDEDFQFTGPVVGPISKDAFLGAYSNVKNLYGELEDLDFHYRDVRV